MSATLELDERRREALERVARRRKVSSRRLLEKAVDEFIERAEDEELHGKSARATRRTKARPKDASINGQKDRERLNSETIKLAKSSGLTEDDDIEGMIKNLREKRLAET